MTLPLRPRSLAHSVVVAAAASLLTGPAVAGCAGCVLVWADEFDGDAVDPAKWEFMIGDGSAYGIPGWGNAEEQYYRAENAEVSDGTLRIVAREQFFGGRAYTSARLRSKGRGDWTYGRFEARMQLPYGQGIWPAFWMLPSDDVYGGWAASGEIDIMEIIGSEPDRIVGSLHYGAESPGNVSTSSVRQLAPGAGRDYHVYAIEWEPGEIRWYVDDVLYGVRTSWWSAGGPYPAPFDQPFHLLLNVAVGGIWPGSPDATTVFPQTLTVDYVRVYQRPGDIAPPRRIVDDMEHAAPFANGWFAFDSSIAGGGLDANFTDLPPEDAGSVSLQAGWGSGGTPGYFGGFGRTRRLDLTGMEEFSFWIRPDAGQQFLLAVNLQDDDDGDGAITAADDEFEYECRIGPAGPCAIAGGGWQRVVIPLAAFEDDNTVFPGGNGVLDAVAPGAGGNGELINVVLAIVSDTGADVTFRTDYWAFEGMLPDADGDSVTDIADNCLLRPNPAQDDSDGDGIGNACDPDIAGGDCRVNIADLSALKSAFLGISGSPGYNPSADFTGPDGEPDGAINLSDLALLKQFMFGVPGPSGLPNDCL